MNILALDQSSRITGWAIFKNNELIKYGKFNAEDHSSDLAKRLTYIKNKVKQLIEEHQIDQLLIEDIQMQNNVVNNVWTYRALAEVIGVLEEYASANNIPYKTIPSATWKSKLNIKGKTRPEQKRNAQQWVIDKYDLKPTQDECDAICIGASFSLEEESAF